jgi:autotransporter-associated beta strand protein
VVTNAAATSLGIVKQGPGKLVLSASNTFNGSVIIAAGTLALSSNGSFNNATNLVIPGGMTFDVSALNSTWTTPNSQALRVTSQNGVAANINCGAIGGLKMGNASPLFLEYANGTPALNISGGNFTLGGGTVTITVLGSPLPHGLYLLADTSSGGSVSGNATNAVAISGAGLAPGLTAKLDFTGGKLYLNVQQFFIAYDAGLGLFGGENVIFTNVSGTAFYAWSSADPTIPVTAWNLEGRMNELPLGTSGFSRYGINLNPGVSPTYYIFGTTNTGPYNPMEPLAWLTTDDFVIFSVTTTNAPISTNGIFLLPTPPIITQQPAAKSVIAGQTANFSIAAYGPALSYQWFFNNSIVPNASAPTLVLTNVNLSQAGSYFVVVTNYLESATSSLATLTISLPPAISVLSSTPGDFQITGNSLTGLTYVVESTTDLAAPAWVPVWTNNTGISGNLVFQTNSFSDTNYFFRLRFP